MDLVNNIKLEDYDEEVVERSTSLLFIKNLNFLNHSHNNMNFEMNMD
jgi:hypothetical protein